MFRRHPKNQIISDILINLESKSSVNVGNRGSKARALIEAVTEVMGSINDSIIFNISQSMLSEATGAALDLIAHAYGLRRIEAQPARIEASDRNFKYYVKGMTFGDINNGNSIIVPAGTVLKSSTANSAGQFIQSETVVLPAASSEYYFAADQMITTSSSNFSRNIINNHTFTGYAQASFKTLRVTNEFGISARPIESDDNLRFRISNHINNSATGNQLAVRLAALQEPGVSDIKILPGRAGAGTYDVVVYGVDPQVSTGLLQRVQERVDRVSAAGMAALAVQPRLVGVSLRAIVKFEQGITTGQKNAAINSARQQIREYINSTNSGSFISINQLYSIILNSSRNIISVGRAGKMFEELLIWRSASPGTARYSRNLTKDYLVRRDEDAIIEPGVANPIDIVEAV